MKKISNSPIAGFSNHLIVTRLWDVLHDAQEPLMWNSEYEWDFLILEDMFVCPTHSLKFTLL